MKKKERKKMKKISNTGSTNHQGMNPGARKE